MIQQPLNHFRTAHSAVLYMVSAYFQLKLKPIYCALTVIKVLSLLLFFFTEITHGCLLMASQKVSMKH